MRCQARLGIGCNNYRQFESDRLVEYTQRESIANAGCPLVDGIERGGHHGDGVSTWQCVQITWKPVIVPDRVAGLLGQCLIIYPARRARCRNDVGVPTCLAK